MFLWSASVLWSLSGNVTWFQQAFRTVQDRAKLSSNRVADFFLSASPDTVCSQYCAGSELNQCSQKLAEHAAGMGLCVGKHARRRPIDSSLPDPSGLWEESGRDLKAACHLCAKVVCGERLQHVAIKHKRFKEQIFSSEVAPSFASVDRETLFEPHYLMGQLDWKTFLCVCV